MQFNLFCEGGVSGECVATTTAKVDLVGADLILPFGVLKLQTALMRNYS